MFSGIVQNRGIVRRRTEQNGQIRFAFQLERPEKKLRLGESIAVDGVCLTVAKAGLRDFEADVIRQTLDSTTLRSLRMGEKVNLERSLKFGDRLGGHFVTGHVDGRGKIRKIQKNKANRTFFIEAPRELLKFIAPKGSIAVDGISLTLQGCIGKVFSVGLIPYTLRATSLGRKKTGDFVNLEVDLIARYLDLLNAVVPKRSHRLSLSALKKQGF